MVGGWCSLLLLACGGESAETTHNAGGDSGNVAGTTTSGTGAMVGGSAGSSVGGSAGTSAGGSAGTNTSGSAGAALGGSGTAGTEGDLAPLVPLVSGHSSTFDLKPLNPNQPTMGACDAPTAKVGDALSLEGHSGLRYETPCGLNPYLIEGSGDQLTAYSIESGKLAMSYEYIHSPVAEGESWKIGAIVQTWHRVPNAVVTPAGTFSDCWLRDAGDFSLTYCRGVGLTLLHDEPANYELTLASKNF